MIAVNNRLRNGSALLVVVAAAVAGVAGTADAKTGLDQASRITVREQACTSLLARFQSDMNGFAQHVRLGTHHAQLTDLRRAAGELQRGRFRGCDWA